MTGSLAAPTVSAAVPAVTSAVTAVAAAAASGCGGSSPLPAARSLSSSTVISRSAAESCSDTSARLAACHTNMISR